MPDGQWNDRSIQDEYAANARAEAEVEHAAALITAESLHTRVVHDADRAFERGRVVEVYPAFAEIERFGHRMAVSHFAGIADRDAVVLPLGRYGVDLFDELGGRELFARRDLNFIRFAGCPDFCVGATDIEDEYVHATY